MSDDVTLAEIVRRLSSIEAAIRQQDERHVSRSEYDADGRTQAERDRSHARRLKRLEDGQTWMMRGLAGVAFAVLVQVAIMVVQL